MNEIERLAEILRNLRINNEDDEKMTVALHYFAIKYANHLMGFSTKDIEDILLKAKVGISHTTEIKKMLKLSKYVTVKQDM